MTNPDRVVEDIKAKSATETSKPSFGNIPLLLLGSFPDPSVRVDREDEAVTRVAEGPILLGVTVRFASALGIQSSLLPGLAAGLLFE